MQAAVITSLEKNVDRGAAALFAGACGYAAFTWLGQRTGLPLLGLEAAVAIAAAYVLSFGALSAVKPAARKAPLSVFDLRSLEGMEADELLLTESYGCAAISDNPFERAEQLLLEHYKAAPAPEAALEEEPLLLDDILAELGPDSRVVRLFDAEEMPTPGQLKSRIDRHLGPDEASHQAPDAGQALHDALAELRRSIR